MTPFVSRLLTGLIFATALSLIPVMGFAENSLSQEQIQTYEAAFYAGEIIAYPSEFGAYLLGIMSELEAEGKHDVAEFIEKQMFAVNLVILDT